MKQSKAVSRTLWAVYAAVIVALLAGVFALGQATVANAAPNDPANVETWEELQAAVETGGSITVTQSIVAQGTLNVSKDVTITGADGGVTITRERDSVKSQPLFNVTAGNLTLGQNLTLSGLSATCEEGGGSGGGQFWKINSGSVTPWVLLDGSDANASTFKLYYKEGPADADGNPTWVESSTLKAGEVIITFDLNETKYSFQTTGAGATTAQLIDMSTITGSSEQYAKWTASADGSGFKLRAVQEDSEGRNSLFITQEPYDDGSGPQDVDCVTVGTTGDTFYFNNGKFSTESGGGGGKTCDESPSCTPWTSAEFNGSVDEPKGFFVQVGSGATATLAGATLTNFVTDKSVVHAAPVVANGGTFNVESGSIEHNSVGYTADNSKWNETARTIGKEDESGSFQYNGEMKDWDKTETAGGIIYTNGATGTISGGDITGNRGDTGGVLVQGAANNDAATVSASSTSNVTFTTGKINENIGVHHGGGMTVYNGAKVTMGAKGGANDGDAAATIASNFSWHKGGGVFVSEEVFGSFRSLPWFPGGDARQQVADAEFILNSGTIDGNEAVHRGGGIQVASDHVMLYGGVISNNTSRTLGGGVYVEGDEGRMYQLWVGNGCISGNEAVNVEGMKAVAKGPSNTADGCDFTNDLADAGTDVTYETGFWGEEGDGGGLWLCPLGGNATFSLGNGKTVTVGGNTATNAGQDVFVRHPDPGVGNGINVISMGSNEFKTEDGAGGELQVGNTYAGQLALKNAIQTCDGGGVSITGNTAIAGGGIGANGTVIFGEARSTYRAAAGLELTKDWGTERAKEPVTIKTYIEVGDQRAALDEVELDGVADAKPEDDVNSSLSSYEIRDWVASIGLPLAVVMPDGTTQSLFTVTVGDEDEEYDPAKIDNLQAIYQAKESGAEIAVKDWNLVIEEVNAAGEVQKYVLPAAKAVLASVETGKIAESYYEDQDGNPAFVDQDGNPVAVGTYELKFAFTDGIINDNEPTIEKYVAKDVHKDVAINEEYDYDILAYVPLDADSIEINDTLEPTLSLVSTKADIEGSVVVKKTNNHTVNGTVASSEVSDATVSAVATISGQSIKVEIADAAPARGQYVQVTFKAKVTADATHVPIDDNGTVLEGAASHEGIPNDATYKIKVGNAWSSDYESNTVTVKPKEEEPAIEKYVNKNVHKDIEIAEPFTYDVIAYITKDADEVTITDTLVDILEFATDASAVAVVDLGEEEPDHTPNGSVAKDGTPVTGATPAISGQTLTVQIADATDLRGHWVKVTFDAKIKAGTKASDLAKAYRTISNNTPVITEEEHTGIPNTASYEIGVKNESGVAEKKYEKPSNTVTVKPDVEVPELEKYIAQDVHLADVADDATFTYDIVAYVAKDADEIEITDELNANLDFVSAQGDVKVADLGTTNNHNTNGDFTAKNENATVASAGSDITSGANIAISGKTLTVGITDIASKDLRGHYVRVTFTAKIAQDAGYEKVDDNGTVNSDKSHEGIPNKASYRTKVGNEWNSDYDLESNVVTVTPNKPEEPNPNDEPTPENPEGTLSAEASTVTKTWADGGNAKDRDDVEFQLYRKVGDGAWEAVQGQTVTLTSENENGLTTWTGRFENLPAYEGGQKISYRAVEANSADFEGLYTPDPDEEIIIVDVDSTSGMGATNHPFTPNTSVEISKQAVGGGPELPGATLIVRDASGNEVARWVSDTNPHSLTLEPGVYTLTEIAAPNGYDIAETMTFRVNVDGTVELLQNGQWLSVEDHIVMFDAPTTPGTPDQPNNPATPTRSKAPSKATARTADAVGGATVALLLAAVLGAGGVAYAGSRSRASRKK